MRKRKIIEDALPLRKLIAQMPFRWMFHSTLRRRLNKYRVFSRMHKDEETGKIVKKSCYKYNDTFYF
jgi:hypothetical protein